MPTRSSRHQRTDPLVLLAIGWAAAAGCVVLIALDSGPVALLPVGLAALPLAASRRSAIAFRLGAALLLGALAPVFGFRTWLLFAPSAIALLASCAPLLTPRAAPRRSR